MEQLEERKLLCNYDSENDPADNDSDGSSDESPSGAAG